jgi:hypothetical protein
MFDRVEAADYVKGTTRYVKANEDASHIGLVVYNTNTSGDFYSGLHFWDGSEWKRMDFTPVIQPQITRLIGLSAVMTPSRYDANYVFDGILKVPYLGGNGGVYLGTASTPITPDGHGLSIERIAGKLAEGGGEVMYRITGQPDITSPNPVDFDLDFLGQGTHVTIGNSVSSLNLKNLTGTTVVNQPYESVSGGIRTRLPASGANTLLFGEILITETGSYAFSLRLYGRVSHYANDVVQKRIPFYIFLQKDTRDNVIDAAEIDLVTGHSEYYSADYSYSVNLGGFFNAGDRVLISMQSAIGYTWSLVSNPDSDEPVRTSLIYWKL